MITLRLAPPPVVRRACGFLVRLVVLVVVLLPPMTVVVNSCRPRMALSGTPAAVNLAYEDVTLTTSDGLRLSAWWIPSPGSTRTLVVCHGVGANRDDLLRFYPFLHQGGYHLLTWDWRGHGASPLARVTFGPDEQADLEAALSWLSKTRPGESAWLGAFAISMGAGIVLQGAGRCPRIRAYVLDSPFVSIRSMLPWQYRLVPGPLRALMVPWTAACARVVLGTSIDAIAPIDHVPELGERPVLVVHGMADTVIPSTQSEVLCRELDRVHRGRHECWLVDGAPHTAVREIHPDAYHDRVLGFLAKVP